MGHARRLFGLSRCVTIYAVVNHKICVQSSAPSSEPACVSTFPPPPPAVSLSWLQQPWVVACIAIAGCAVVAAACLVGRWLFNQHQDKQQLHQQHTVIEPEAALVGAGSSTAVLSEGGGGGASGGVQDTMDAIAGNRGQSQEGRTQHRPRVVDIGCKLRTRGSEIIEPSPI